MRTSPTETAYDLTTDELFSRLLGRGWQLTIDRYQCSQRTYMVSGRLRLRHSGTTVSCGETLHEALVHFYSAEVKENPTNV